MKQKFTFIALFILALQVSSFAQNKKSKMPPPLVSDEAISTLVVSDNIDVVFIQDKTPFEGVKVTEEKVGKISARVVDGTLYLSTFKKRVAGGERVPVYVTINDLETLTLKGNSFATSRGVINARNLQVNLSREAKVSLKSVGKLNVNAPGNYQVTKEAGYSSLVVTD